MSSQIAIAESERRVFDDLLLFLNQRLRSSLERILAEEEAEFQRQLSAQKEGLSEQDQARASWLGSIFSFFRRAQEEEEAGKSIYL